MGRFSNLFAAAQDEAPSAPANTPTLYRLLLVDDEPNITSALRRVFRQENYQIVVAGNGQEALEILKQERFQLMISDYMMPVMNGADLLRKAREIYPDMIRIMLTGNADTNAVMAAIKEGAVYKFILKPWNDDDLRVTVALALDQYELTMRNNQLQKNLKQQAKEIAALSKISISHRSRLAVVLNKNGVISDAQLQELYRLQQQQKTSAIQLILDKDWVSQKKIRDILLKDRLIEEVQLAEINVDEAVAVLVPKNFCERQLVIPLRLNGKRLVLAMADPLDEGLIEDMRFVSGLEIQPVYAALAEIRKKISEVYPKSEAIDFTELETLTLTEQMEGIEVIIDEDDSLPLEELLSGSEEPPAIRLVNAILLEAIRLGASDIHIHPRTKNVMVRYRLDGILTDKIQIPHQLHQSLVSRMKIMSELDISERRRPQDGRITIKSPLRVADLRISTLPTINGEKIVLRILDRNASVQSIDQLGFLAHYQRKVENLTERPQGMILATGPTGSGKTTTLYSLLQHNADQTKNYVTIEDPVEYYLDSAGQVMIREKIGLTFPTVLRSILRQDPDVILLGEIRDHETAEVAFHASLTGHLVYSTLHTNSAVATVSRLFDLGVKPYVIATALEGIIAQRLVRKICEHCKTEIAPNPLLVEKLGPSFASEGAHFYKGNGCEYCHGTGYRGRHGLYEVLRPNDEVRNLIAESANILEVTRAAQRAGMETLLQDACRKVQMGLTTAEEVLRVLGPQI
jgi:type II secretory ATPase GspE/PulE/Tfp pilus assembly ATPase PilB-like protein/DNA-binding response OmpR family regulator